MALPPKYDLKYPDLENSDLHLDLKNQPGEDGDPDHAKDAKSTVSDEVAEAVAQGDGSTPMGAALKDAVEDDRKD